MPLSRRDRVRLLRLLKKARAVKKKKQQQIKIYGKYPSYRSGRIISTSGKTASTNGVTYGQYKHKYQYEGIKRTKRPLATLRPKRKIKRFDDVFSNAKDLFNFKF